MGIAFTICGENGDQLKFWHLLFREIPGETVHVSPAGPPTRPTSEIVLGTLDFCLKRTFLSHIGNQITGALHLDEWSSITCNLSSIDQVGTSKGILGPPDCACHMAWFYSSTWAMVRCGKGVRNPSPGRCQVSGSTDPRGSKLQIMHGGGYHRLRTHQKIRRALSANV